VNVNTLPPPRGRLSEWLMGVLVEPPHPAHAGPTVPPDDPLADEDLHLSLYLLYELHYRGLPGVDERWEWNGGLLDVRARLEALFEAALLETVPLGDEAVPPEEMDLALRAVSHEEGPPLSRYIRSAATLDQVREFVVHRSAYQLKEADPHSWAIPRLFGAPKAALIEIQADEYGRGRTEWIHAELFAQTMRALSLDSSYGAYLPLIPGVSLATVNLMSLLGLHRRWRAAIVGHLALFEMSSSIPNRRYAQGLRRLGFGREATLFFDEHVTADAVHENIAAVDLAGGLVRQDPAAAAGILWGARALNLLEARWAGHLLDSWQRSTASLLAGLDARPVGEPQPLGPVEPQPLGPVIGPEPDQLVGPVAERLDL
jgi:hypothetical protein